MLYVLSVFQCEVVLLEYFVKKKNIIRYFLVVVVVEEKIVEKCWKHLEILEKLQVGRLWKIAGNGSRFPQSFLLYKFSTGCVEGKLFVLWKT